MVGLLSQSEMGASKPSTQSQAQIMSSCPRLPTPLNNKRKRSGDSRTSSKKTKKNPTTPEFVPTSSESEAEKSVQKETAPAKTKKQSKEPEPIPGPSGIGKKKTTSAKAKKKSKDTGRNICLFFTFCLIFRARADSWAIGHRQKQTDKKAIGQEAIT